MVLGLAQTQAKDQPRDDNLDQKGKRLTMQISQFPTQLADSIELRVFIRIHLSNLVFVRSGNEFKAAFEISLFVVGDQDKALATHIWREEISRPTFKATRNPDSAHHSSVNIIVPDGEYEVVVQLIDLDNRNTFGAREEIVINPISPDSLVLSDLLLATEIKYVDGEPIVIMPKIGNRISDNVDTVYIYLSVRNPTSDPMEVTLQYSLKDDDDEEIAGHEQILPLSSTISTYLIPQATEPLTGREYQLEVKLSGAGMTTSRTFPITIDWTGFSQLIKDIDKAIEQIRYVTSREQLNEMKQADREKGHELFQEFWRALDPSPNTPRNELMDEYYRRVAYSNQHFKSYREGWETDFGMVYIVYGPPDEIERHPFDSQSKPYQVWLYYDKGWRFFFVDVNMFGDFRLDQSRSVYPRGSAWY